MPGVPAFLLDRTVSSTVQCSSIWFLASAALTTAGGFSSSADAPVTRKGARNRSGRAYPRRVKRSNLRMMILQCRFVVGSVRGETRFSGTIP